MWACCFLQPMLFSSAYDPPVVPPFSFLSKLRFIGRSFHRCLFWLGKRRCRSWADPWHRLRADIELPPTLDNPLFEGLYSPSLILAMFSPAFASKQPDWPPQTVVSGFAMTDQGNAVKTSPELVRFLNDGPPPIVFTLGSSAVLAAGPFFEAQRCRRQTARPKGSTYRRPRPREPASIPLGQRRRVRICPLLAAFSTSRRNCPCRRYRDDSLGDAFGSSHASHALRPRPIRQCRAGDPTWDRPHDFPAPIQIDPCCG